MTSVDVDVIVYEKQPVSLLCPGFLGTQYEDATFQWIRGRNYSHWENDDRLAVYSERYNMTRTYGDLQDRAIVQSNTGILTILQTRLDDSQHYICRFKSSPSEMFQSQVKLTVLPEIMGERTRNITVHL